MVTVALCLSIFVLSATKCNQPPYISPEAGARLPPATTIPLTLYIMLVGGGLVGGYKSFTSPRGAGGKLMQTIQAWLGFC